TLAQTGPAVCALQELVAEAQAQPWMRSELGHPLDPELPRAIAPHAEHVRVVEPERLGRPRMSPRQSGAQLLVVRNGLLREDLGAQGAAVLGIAIDVATLQRAPQHTRAAELAPVLDLFSRIARQLRGDLAQD